MPAIIASCIAAVVSFVTLFNTWWNQKATQQMTRREGLKNRDAQTELLNKTLAEQEKQLGRSLDEQRAQLERTLNEQSIQTLNERFATAAGQLGGDKPPEVRLAGVYAMAVLADDWKDNRQVCVDVLCGFLRMPYAPDPGPDADEGKRLSFEANREVRHTTIRLIAEHLKKDKDDRRSWQGLDFDFRNVVFDGGSFAQTRFSGGTVSFENARFSSGTVDFSHAKFSGGTVRGLFETTIITRILGYLQDFRETLRRAGVVIGNGLPYR